MTNQPTMTGELLAQLPEYIEENAKLHNIDPADISVVREYIKCQSDWLWVDLYEGYDLDSALMCIVSEICHDPELLARREKLTQSKS